MSELLNDWIVIGISGVTCGGKTTLALKLKEALVPACVFHQDKYFYPDNSPHHIKCKGLDHNNYDILSSLNMDQMYKDIVDTIGGTNKSHGTNEERIPGKYGARNKRFLIVEGFTVLNFKPIMDICNLRYYFVLNYEECAARRCFRLYDPPDIAGYFDQCVWPEHLKYRAEIEKDKTVTILEGTWQNSLEIVMNDLQALGLEQIK